MRVMETAVYTFDELDDDAKEKAREWFRGYIEHQPDDLADYDDWQAVAGILGIDFDTRRNSREPAIYWSGFCSQGDGACFTGTYRYAKGAPAKIRAYASKDTELHGIADRLQAIQRKYFYKLEAQITQSGRYCHSGTMTVNTEYAGDRWRDIGDAGDDIQNEMRRFADWIYSRLEAEYDYLNSDEYVGESIRAMEYEFTESGERI